MSLIRNVCKINFWRKKIIYFLWKYIKKSRRYDIYNQFNKDQWNVLEKNKEIQKKKLFAIVDYAVKNIAYYKKIVKKNNISISEETILTDIKKFPILTKEIIKKNFSIMYQKNKLNIKNSTGGTTGKPLRFFIDNKFFDNDMATKILFNSWCGINEGEKVIMLWGSERDIMGDNNKIKDWLFEKIFNVKVLNSFNMSERKMYEYAMIIKNKNLD